MKIRLEASSSKLPERSFLSRYFSSVRRKKEKNKEERKIRPIREKEKPWSRKKRITRRTRRKRRANLPGTVAFRLANWTLCHLNRPLWRFNHDDETSAATDRPSSKHLTRTMLPMLDDDDTRTHTYIYTHTPDGKHVHLHETKRPADRLHYSRNETSSPPRIPPPFLGNLSRVLVTYGERRTRSRSLLEERKSEERKRKSGREGRGRGRGVDKKGYSLLSPRYVLTLPIALTYVHAVYTRPTRSIVPPSLLAVSPSRVLSSAKRAEPSRRKTRRRQNDCRSE